ncbi:hypothetical protein BM477_00285 [Boudabousia marimammalium]|uniref:Glucosyl-3-phosphoglycerate synthase n=2 Tax=Boudabousia marimammalium TaxID=156892 RepID=A0A1Q5PSN6_9ACTO|nr:hypothetical protein BM477_00285 [Boudabousia marimammalium]
MNTIDYSQQVAVVIPAYNEGTVIATTVRACHILPGTDLIIVVDDGSTDDTQDRARAAGAVVVRHAVNRGKASAMETGLKVAAMRDPEEGRGRSVLFMDADVGESALEAIKLINTVRGGGVGMAIGDTPREVTSGGRGFVSRLARRNIAAATGWRPRNPLSGQRCLSWESAQKVLPFSRGWGVEVGMTIDLLVQGFSVVEVETEFQHLNSESTDRIHRLSQYKDVMLAMWGHRLTGRTLRSREFRDAARSQKPYEPYVVGGLPGAGTAVGGGR